MSKPHSPATQRPDPEPRWPAVLALLAVCGLRLTLPQTLAPGPDWLVIALVAALVVPAIFAHHRGYHGANQWLGYGANAVVTLAMIWSLALLVWALPSHRELPKQLFRSTAILWVSNILVFASWYWRLDAGGPYERDLRDAHTEGAFLFPQMTINTGTVAQPAPNWRPGFVDYLFLAYTASTAFSPTDTPVLSRWAKGLMMVQAAISLATIAVLAARAVSIL